VKHLAARFGERVARQLLRGRVHEGGAVLGIHLEDGDARIVKHRLQPPLRPPPRGVGFAAGGNVNCLQRRCR
jgi:hypothetical protein